MRDDVLLFRPAYCFQQESSTAVILAFELYRTCYWRRDREERSHRHQRDEDIEAILFETVEEAGIKTHLGIEVNTRSCVYVGMLNRNWGLVGY